MPSTLQRILLFLGSIAAFLLVLTAINYLWPFTEPNPSSERPLVGFAFDLTNFVFATSSYAMIRARRTQTGLILISIWSIATLVYAFWLLLFNPLSLFTVGIFVGLLLFCAIMGYLAIAEARSSGVLKNGSPRPVA
jgi:hypothetical protein